MNSSSDDDRRLESLLQRVAPALPDDGFSQRVLASLPPPRPRLRGGMARLIWCGAGAGAGAVLAWQKGVDAETLAAAADRLRESVLQLGNAGAANPMTVNDSWLWISLGVAAASLLVAFAPDITRRWPLR